MIWNDIEIEARLSEGIYSSHDHVCRPFRPPASAACLLLSPNVLRLVNKIVKINISIQNEQKCRKLEKFSKPLIYETSKKSSL